MTWSLWTRLKYWLYARSEKRSQKRALINALKRDQKKQG